MMHWIARRPGLAATIAAGFAAAALAGLTALSDAVWQPDAWLKTADDIESRRRQAFIFERNLGQADDTVSMIGRGQGMRLLFEPAGIIRLSRSGDGSHGLRLSVDGARADAFPEPEGALPGRTHYLLGADARRWVTDVSTYGRARYTAIRPGIDLVFHNRDSVLEFDFELDPHVSPDLVRLRIDGAHEADLTAAGDLVLSTEVGPVELRAPDAYQVDPAAPDVRRPVPVAFEMLGTRSSTESADLEIGFAVGPHDSSLPLVIDPQVIYSTFWGGPITSGNNDLDMAFGVATDAKGNTYVVGTAGSANFTTTNGTVQPDYAGNNDAFVTKFAPDGTVIWSTFLGGSSFDSAEAVTVTKSGTVYVLGTTISGDFPTKKASQAYAGGGDLFVSRIAKSGKRLLASTFLGGSGTEQADGIELGARKLKKGLYVWGNSSSTDFPTRRAAQAAYGGGGFDGVLAVLDSKNLGTAMATYIGTDGSDELTGGAFHDKKGDLYLVGDTSGFDIPPFVAHLSPRSKGPKPLRDYDLEVVDVDSIVGSPTQVSFAALAAGASGEESASSADSGYETSGGGPRRYEIAVVMAGRCTVLTGQTQCFERGTILFLDERLRLQRARNFGGDGVGIIDINGAATAPDKSLVIVGQTTSDDVPLADELQAKRGGSWDGYVIAVTPTGSDVIFGSFLGGSQGDFINDVAVDRDGYIHMVGQTMSSDYPNSGNAQQKKLLGRNDGFVIKLGKPNDDPER